MGKLERLADSIRKDFRVDAKPFYSIEAVRDHCDLCTGSDLNTTQLDILTDMVAARIEQDGAKVTRMTYKSGDLVKVKILKAHEGLPQETGDFNAQVLGEYQIAGEPQIRVRVDHPESGWHEWVLDCAAEMVSTR